MSSNKVCVKKNGKRKFQSEIGKTKRYSAYDNSTNVKRFCPSEMNKERLEKEGRKNTLSSPPSIKSLGGNTKNKKKKKSSNVTFSTPHVSTEKNKSMDYCLKLNSQLKITDENVDSSSNNKDVSNLKQTNNKKLSVTDSTNKCKSNTENGKKIVKVASEKRVDDLCHKNTTGNNNWMRFLKEQNSRPRKLKVASQAAEVSSTNPKVKLTKVVGLDCEMVGIGENGRENMLARVSLVNSLGECIYDKFVKPREEVVDYRTPVSGVRPEDMTHGEDFEVVQKEVAEIIKNRLVVGHALSSDFDVLFLSHPRKFIRDTSRYLREPGKGTPSLKKLSAQHLGIKIQEGEHNSVQDARATIHLYNMFRKEWESGSKANFYKDKKILEMKKKEKDAQ